MHLAFAGTEDAAHVPFGLGVGLAQGVGEATGWMGICGDGIHPHGGVKCWVCPGALCNGFTEAALRTPLDYTPVPAFATR